MMTKALKGKTLEESKAFTQLFKTHFGVQDETLSPQTQYSIDDLGDLEALSGVKKYPVRIKCVLLSWNTFLESLKNLK
jgi:nitrogen fixation NifU-like protein